MALEERARRENFKQNKQSLIYSSVKNIQLKDLKDSTYDNAYAAHISSLIFKGKGTNEIHFIKHLLN